MFSGVAEGIGASFSFKKTPVSFNWERTARLMK